MVYVEIAHVKEFTAQLFAGNAFDEYLLSEALFCTAATYTIDGRINESFVGEEGMRKAQFREGMIPWQMARPVCYEILKGRKVPSHFRIVLKLPERMLDVFLEQSGMQACKDQVSGLFLNISFKNRQLSCTSGTAMKTFTLDKSLEEHWDACVKNLFRQYE